MKTAIIVVDVQKFFLHDAPNDFPKKVAEHIKATNYPVVAFTVFKNQPDSNFVRSLKWKKSMSHTDTKLPPEFDEFIKDNVFVRAAYSGFESTNLHEYLTRQAIEKVVICGMDTDACVLATAFSAFDKGYMVDVNFDLTISQAGLENESAKIIKRNIEPN